MDIKFELLKEAIADFVNNRIEEMVDVDISRIADTRATNALREIQKVLQNDEYDDFRVVEEIVLIFEKHKLNAGTRHDFG